MSHVYSRLDNEWRIPGSAPAGSDRDALVAGTYKPDATTTGVRPGSTLTLFNGNVVFSSDGQVVENLDIRGSVDFNGKNNCTLRNCKIVEQTPREMPGVWRYGVRQFGINATGTIVEDCEIYPATPGENHGYAFWGFLNNGMFRRNNVHGFIDGCNVSATPGSIIQNWFHDSTTWIPHVGWADGQSHNDAIQLSNGVGWVIRGNTFDWATGGTSNILLSRGAGDTYSNLIDRNWFDGGFLGINLADPLLGGQTITNNLAADRAAFTGSGIHIFSLTAVTALCTITGNLTYTDQAWFIYNNG